MFPAHYHPEIFGWSFCIALSRLFEILLKLEVINRRYSNSRWKMITTRCKRKEVKTIKKDRSRPPIHVSRHACFPEYSIKPLVMTSLRTINRKISFKLLKNIRCIWWETQCFFLRHNWFSFVFMKFFAAHNTPVRDF